MAQATAEFAQSNREGTRGHEAASPADLARPTEIAGEVPETKGRLLTVGQAIRAFCLQCVGATSARGAFDCGSTICPLRPASPFVGKPMPVSLRPSNYKPTDEPALIPKRRPTLRLIHAQCRQCQPEDRSDCRGDSCSLYPWRPWFGPGHAEKRRASPAQMAAAARGRETIRQRRSTAVGAALDA